MLYMLITARRIVVVFLSVHPSVTFLCFVETVKHIKLFQTIILVFCNSARGHSCINKLGYS